MEKLKMACTTDQSFAGHSTPKCFSPFYQREMGMSNYECNICHGRCDPGELRQGVCLDCWEEMKYRELCRNKAERLMTAECRQIKMEDIINAQKE